MIHICQSNAAWTVKQGYSKKVLLTGDQIGVPGVLVQMVRVRPGEKAEIHYHKGCTEIFFFPAGTGEWTVNGKKIEIWPGDFLVIQPGDRHCVHNPNAHDLVYTAFKVNVSPENDYFEDKP